MDEEANGARGPGTGRWLLAAIAVVGAAAAVLRFRGLGDDSLWRDEAASWFQSGGTVADILRATAADNYPPLHNLILAGVTHLLGDGEWALRLPSAVFGVAAVGAIWWVGRLVAGPRAGLVAAVLLALSGYHVWYSQEARMYALFVLAATLYLGASLLVLAHRRTIAGFFVVAAGWILLYSHPYGTLLWLSVTVAGVGAILFEVPGAGIRLRIWLLVQSIVVAGFLPWAVVLLGRATELDARGFWIPYPSAAYLAGEIVRLLDGPWTAAFVLATAAVALVMPVRAAGSKDPRDPPTAAELTMVAAAALGPALIGLVLSLLTFPIFLSRYLLGSLPALLLLSGIGVTRLAPNAPAFAGGLALAAVAAVIGLADGEPGRREDWRGATAEVARMLEPGDCVVTAGSGSLANLSYYLHGSPDCAIVVPASARDRPVDPAFRSAVVVLYGRDVGRGIDSAFPAPRWTVTDEASARGLRVIRLVRAD